MQGLHGRHLIWTKDIATHISVDNARGRPLQPYLIITGTRDSDLKALCMAVRRVGIPTESQRCQIGEGIAAID